MNTFANAPDWATVKVVDRDGFAWFCKKAPSKGNRNWIFGEGNIRQFAGKASPSQALNWFTTMEVRFDGYAVQEARRTDKYIPLDHEHRLLLCRQLEAIVNFYS